MPSQLITKLKEEASEATAVAKEMEDKYHKTAEQLDATRAKLESAWLLNQQLEVDLKAAQSGVPHVPLAKAASCKRLAASMASIHNGRTPDLSDESEYEEETETESEEGKNTHVYFINYIIYMFYFNYNLCHLYFYTIV